MSQTAMLREPSGPSWADVGNFMVLVNLNMAPDAARRIANQWREKCADNARLRAALYEIIELDHHKQSPESRATELARAALGDEQQAQK